MNNIFIICGYGIPRDMARDENYSRYLNVAFNTIYQEVTDRAVKQPLILFSGGPTDMHKPYRRTEGQVMTKYFKKLANRSAVKHATRLWRYVADTKSLSTLENLLLARAVIRRRRITAGRLIVFCETSREEKLRVLSKKIFGKKFARRVVAIDFDTSPSRYVDPQLINKKEKTEIRHALWALRSPANLRAHHRVFVEKVAYLRQIGPSGHHQAIHQWWRKKIQEMQ